jgi:hypothetical protein
MIWLAVILSCLLAFVAFWIFVDNLRPVPGYDESKDPAAGLHRERKR